ncbi:MAG: DNA primase [Bacteroidetes bacterium]|nr:DNA primase [Bacteroidota bacterium]
MITKPTIDLILDAARVEEVIADFITLKKRGVNFIGNCPFHDEKTPSFTVSPVKGIYKCFGCGKAGNSVNFVMDHEQMSYPEALRYLAKKYNIEIEEEYTKDLDVLREEQTERESLFVVNTFAQNYFSEQLLTTDLGKSVGLGYFKERGFTEETIKKFQLGISPDDRKALLNAALQAGYKLEYLIKTGLVIDGERGAFDRFFDRVMFPIHNVTGRVLGFGGRILKTDKKAAKYINSPESDIYNKSKVLYGLFFAKKSIVQEDSCFLVEGYTDVISMHQAGIENVVASSGTSLTVDQIKLIKRYTNNITILYDGDFAGIKASFRGIDMILEEGMNVKVLLFPDGEDPDSYSKKTGKDELKNFIKINSKDFISFKTSILYKDAANDPIKKAGLIHDIVESIARIPDSITRSLYVKECSRLMHLEELVLMNELNKARRKISSTKQQKENASEKQVASDVSSLPENIAFEEIATSSKSLNLNECEFQEKDIIRLLLVYGGSKVSFEVDDDPEKTTELQVAEWIVHELQHDGIKFENDSYQKIFDLFAVKSMEELTNSFFTNHSDKDIATVAISLISSPYELSLNWERHGIIVQKEEGVLRKSVQNAIYSLKSKKLELMIHAIQDKIKTTENTDDLMDLLAEQQQLLEAKKAFNALLGRIITK